MHFRNFILFKEDLVLNLNTLECLEKIFKLPHPIFAFSYEANRLLKEGGEVIMLFVIMPLVAVTGTVSVFGLLKERPIVYPLLSTSIAVAVMVVYLINRH